MKIGNLVDHPDALPLLAEWHWNEWAHLYPDDSLASFTADLQRGLNHQTLPTTLVVYDNDQLLGSASLIEDDMDTHPELGPWLASVYIREDQRGRGLGRMLVQAIMDFAQDRNVAEMFLFTPDQQLFYERLGWAALAQETYHGEPVSLMHYRP